MKKWGHLHTLSIGAILGVVLTAHVWTLLLCAFLAGLFLGRFWNWLLMVEEAVRMKLFHQKKKRKPPPRKPPPDDTAVMPSSQLGPKDPWPGELY